MAKLYLEEAEEELEGEFDDQLDEDDFDDELDEDNKKACPIDSLAAVPL